MLIRYSIENFLSFGQRAEITMIPGKVRYLNNHIIKPKLSNDVSLLKLAIIYGANASGKSNLMRSIKFAKDLILNGTTSGGLIPIRKFRLDSSLEKLPSRFEFEIKIGEKSYSYGFSCNAHKIEEEWLYEITKKKDKMIFERKCGNKHCDVSFGKLKNISKKEEQFLEFLADGTRENQLFLTECYQRNLKNNLKENHDYINTINWFKKLTIIFPNSKFGGLEYELEKNENFAKSLQDYLLNFDTGIDSIKLQKEDFHKITDLPEELKKEIEKDLKKNMKIVITDPENKKTYAISRNEKDEIIASRVIINHKVKNSSECAVFEMGDESDGTQRLFDLIPALMDLARKDRVFMIDELDRSLHPNLSNMIMDIFLSKTSRIESQLLITTHESTLLNLKKFRKDEIWFVEKDKSGQSQLFSLEEFQPRFDKEIRKAYLVGRFGATPVFKESLLN